MGLSPKARHKARAFAMQTLYQANLQQLPVKELIAKRREQGANHKVDWDFFELIVAGVLEDQAALDAQIAPLCDRPYEQTQPVEKALLQLACFEIKNCQEVPDKVILDEYIQLAREYGSESSYKFINSVLDNLL